MASGFDHGRRKRKLSNPSESHLPMAFKSSRIPRSAKKQIDRRDAAADAAIAQLFDKTFEIVNKDFALPEAKNLFASEPWSVDVLQDLKKKLNETKSKLNDYSLDEWSRHTRQRNKAGEVQWRLRQDVKPEFLTQAWCKFYENVSSFPLIPEAALRVKKLRSVHLCEAPGAFVTSLNHWLRLNAPDMDWRWLATTLNPHYEGNSLSKMVNDDRFIMRTSKNWYFGADGTGNLMNLKNMDALVDRAGCKAELVTADGSIDCLDTPAEQEEVVSHLHYCETLAALHLLRKGGSFLLKKFTIFEHQTICLVYLLSCCFERVVIKKPVTSKEGNSEVYAVCLGFAGLELIAAHIEILRRNYETPASSAMFRRDDIPQSFVDQIVSCEEFFNAHQCEVMLSNMRTFRSDDVEYRGDADVKKIKRLVAERFVQHYELRSLPSEEMEIVGKNNLAQQDFTVINFRTPPESYNSRRRRENLDPYQRLSIIVDDLKLITTPDTAYFCKLEGIPDKLLISRGKPIEKVESSKFCAATILKIYNVAREIAKSVGLTMRIPSPDSAREFVQENDGKNEILCFEYTSVPDSHKLITEICDAVTKLGDERGIILVGYSLLSRLSVGLLCLLACTFDSVEWKENEKLGYIIAFNGKIADENVARSLKEIAKVSSEAKLKGEAVLSVLPIETLCDSPLYQHVIKINHWIIKYCVRRIASNFKD